MTASDETVRDLQREAMDQRTAEIRIARRVKAAASPAPLSDEERDAAERIVSGEMTHSPEKPLEYLAKALKSEEHWKRRAEEAERQSDEADAQSDRFLRELIDIRQRLGAGPDARLDGDDGAVAKLKAEEERLTLLASGWYTAAQMRGLCPSSVAIDDEGNGDPFYPEGEILGRGETAQLRAENERRLDILHGVLSALGGAKPGGSDLANLPQDVRALREENERLTRERDQARSLSAVRRDKIHEMRSELADALDGAKALRAEKRALEERVSDLEDRLMKEHEGSPGREEARLWETRAHEKEMECAEWKERALKAEGPLF